MANKVVPVDNSNKNKEKVEITKINNLTVVKQNDVFIGLYSGVHFKLNGENYFLYIPTEYTITTKLYKGRNKGKLELESCVYGMAEDLIIFKRKPKCLKYINTNHFIKRLVEMGLLIGGELK